MHRILRRSLLAFCLTAFSAGTALPAFAQGASASAASATAFLEGKLKAVRTTLQAPPSADRDKKIDADLSTLLDYDEMAKVALGEEYGKRSKEEISEFTGILRQLIEKNYKKRLQDTLNFEITQKGEEPAKDKEGKPTGDTLVKTEAKNLKDKKASPVAIEYVVRKKGSGFIAVDIIPEGSSMARTYNKEFTKVIKKEGWAALIKKMKDKLAKS